MGRYTREIQAEMIVRELAASDPVLTVETLVRTAELHCTLCEKRDKVEGFEHRPSCLWLRAARWTADA